MTFYARLSSRMSRYRIVRCGALSRRNPPGNGINEGSPYCRVRTSDIIGFTPRFIRHFWRDFLGMYRLPFKYYAGHRERTARFCIGLSWHYVLLRSLILYFLLWLQYMAWLAMPPLARRFSDGNWTLVPIAICRGAFPMATGLSSRSPSAHHESLMATGLSSRLPLGLCMNVFGP